MSEVEEEAIAKRELELCMYPRGFGVRWLMSRGDFEWLTERLAHATGPHREAMRRSLEVAEIA